MNEYIINKLREKYEFNYEMSVNLVLFALATFGEPVTELQKSTMKRIIFDPRILRNEQSIGYIKKWLPLICPNYAEKVLAEIEIAMEDNKQQNKRT